MQCKYLALLKIDPDNNILDELLTENLISATKTNDRMHNERIKIIRRSNSDSSDGKYKELSH